MKILREINLDLKNLRSTGERRRFYIIGDNGARFRLEIKNEDGHYYNFNTETFSATQSDLESSIAGSRFDGYIQFPLVTDEDHYDIFLWTDNITTRHSNYNEVRFEDGSIDINSSTGSDSTLVRKIIRQYTGKTFTITAAAPTLSDSGEGFEGATITTDTISVETNDKVYKKDFTITVTADSGHSLKIDRNPSESDVYVNTTRIIGDPLAISGEEVSSSTYSRWNIKSNSSIHGLFNDMEVTGTNIAAGTKVSDYDEEVSITIDEGGWEESMSPGAIDSGSRPAEVGSTRTTSTIKEKKVHVDGIDPFGYKPTISQGVITKQLGNVTFDTKQPAALADDTDVVFWAYGTSQISKLTGNVIKLSNLKVELTDVTTTVNDASATGSAALSDFDVASVAGIMDDVSVVSGVNMLSTVVNPTVTTISSSNLTVTPGGHYLQNGQTLTFKGASTIATITGTLEIKYIGDFRTVAGASVAPSITFNLEKFLTAV
jgi:hypothetical protein